MPIKTIYNWIIEIKRNKEGLQIGLVKKIKNIHGLVNIDKVIFVLFFKYHLLLTGWHNTLIKACLYLHCCPSTKVNHVAQNNIIKKDDAYS